MSAIVIAVPAAADDNNGEPASVYSSLKLRGIGPAITSGRITDFAMHPQRWQEYFVATASGGLWKTANNGITWQPVFDKEASYSIGVVMLDPDDPLTVWVGTGENNSQRSVAFGDGVYKSIDGGRSWANVGLKDSEHIGQIAFHPDDSATVYVAAQGPLWNSGGDRGLYRSSDGGASWHRILHIDKHTGVNEFVIHPQQPQRMLASSYQRRRHVWTLINGGPGSGIHKSTDGGESWRKITAGLPSGDMGRIGLGMAPSNPDIVYAIVEADAKEKGIYRSTDFGENWEKRSDYMASSPQYYNELIVDPHNPDRVYSMDTFARVSHDGGKTWQRLGIEHRHVDDHALWIDPANTDHLIIGGDGGIYESWDMGQTWRHVRNLPITQFYRATPDNAKPFYRVYGGTQDNNSLGAPSRTTNIHGIANSDWLLVLGGDGYKPQIDPQDPNIVYAQYQYGGLARYDRRTNERVYITPQPDNDSDQLRWNWNSPLVLSHHDRKRLYYGAERVFRTDDMGNSWRAISGDLSRQLDRNKLEVMDRVWSVDAISKNRSTSLYGSLIALAESPFDENLLYAGTDDGLIQVTTDGGTNWRRVNRFSGVPDMSLVEDIIASQHDADVAYAVFDNHKRGDFKPYVLVSRDRGRSWRSISGNLPERGSAHTIIEDHVDPDLLFVGTEFGVFFTQDRGRKWIQLKGGFPTIAVRDLEIQQREQDLVIGTFGRGIYILDDYTPLRVPFSQLADSAARLFPVKDALLYIEGSKWGGNEKGSMGHGFYAAPNPPYGAVFTYYLRDGLKTRKDARREKEKEVRKEGGDTPYPEWNALRAEDREQEPKVFVVVRDSDGAVVNRVSGPTNKGIHRIAWDLRLAAPDPVKLGDQGFRSPWASDPIGPLALPGRYTATLVTAVDGKWSDVSQPVAFNVTPLDEGAVLLADRAQLQQFQLKTARLSRAVKGAVEAGTEIQSRIDHLQEALLRTPAASAADQQRLREIELAMADISVALRGDQTLRSRSEVSPWSISQRVSSIVGGHWKSQSRVTDTHQRAYDLAASAFGKALADLREVRDRLVAFEADADRMLAPWTPGRLPDWQPE
ncbi:MAG: glycosyl hydrolase [Gammaproteobacteria bacterium]|nr:glycosyl hydrolase [Gammaproteobacteria bacterium]NNM20526.1 glycosyl hydrolase [Gammaproteobacteria bacterium]